MGINIGALIGPLLTGLLQKSAGFHWGFGAGGGRHGDRPDASTPLGRKDLPEQPATSPTRCRGPPALDVAMPSSGVALIAVLRRGTGVITADEPGRRRRRRRRCVAAIGVLRGDPVSSKKVDARRAQPGLAFIPLFIGQRRVLVAVPAAVHRRRRSTPTSGSTGTSSAGRCRSRGCSRSTRSSSSSCAGVFAAMWTRLGDRQPSTPIKFALGDHRDGRRLPAVPALWPAPGPQCPLLWIVLILLVSHHRRTCWSPRWVCRCRPSSHRRRSTPRWSPCSSCPIALGTALAGTLAGYYTPDTRSPTSASSVRAIAIVVVMLLISLSGAPGHARGALTPEPAEGR